MTGMRPSLCYMTCRTLILPIRDFNFVSHTSSRYMSMRIGGVCKFGKQWPGCSGKRSILSKRGWTSVSGWVQLGASMRYLRWSNHFGNAAGDPSMLSGGQGDLAGMLPYRRAMNQRNEALLSSWLIHNSGQRVNVRIRGPTDLQALARLRPSKADLIFPHTVALKGNMGPHDCLNHCRRHFYSDLGPCDSCLSHNKYNDALHRFAISVVVHTANRVRHLAGT